MKYKYSLLLLTLLPILGGYADGQDMSSNSLELGSLSVPSVVSERLCLNNSPYSFQDIVIERVAIKDVVRTREIDYSWFWIRKVIDPDLLVQALTDDIYLASDIGEHRDDALILQWRSNGFDFELIDSRVITLLVKKQGLLSSGVLETFREVINYGCGTNRKVVQVHIEEENELNEQASYGRIGVNRGNATGWFELPISWFKSGDSILFVFEKFLKPPVSKVPVVDVTLIVGGISCEDTRSYLRFDQFNRADLAEEYFSKRYQPTGEESDSGVTLQTKGIPLQRD